MSVINQMLKDLDQRTPEQGHVVTTTEVPQKLSTLKIVLLSAVVLLSLNALGFYIWHLQEQIAQNELKQRELKQTEVNNTENRESVQIQQSIQPEKTISNNAKKQSVQPLKAEPNPVIHVAKVVQPPVAELPAKSAPVLTEKPTEQGSIIEKKTPSKMSVSRRQLTSKELIAQKLARAEKLVNMNEIFKAEQFFEDILIIDPNHKQARKKLAALWFGRQAYQQAVNLLSQGIALDNQDSELRLMKARIHLKQGQHEAVYNTLKPLSSIEQEEYQLMLANIAQKIEQYPSAINAYQILIKMQPYSGRWHLGLAIVYDKTSQFPLAVNEYELALSKADLSASSAKFAQQRKQALGE